MHLPLIESVRARELVALANLGAATGNRSLCSLARSGTSVPSAKYHEGAAAALAEARRAIKSIVADSDAAPRARAAILGIRARWQARLDAMGRAGPDWAGYLTGGLDALDQLIADDDEGRGAHDARH